MNQSVGVNIDVLSTEVNNMQNSANSLDFSVSATLSKTDISPFTDFLINISSLNSAITEYKNLAVTDAKAILEMGQKISETDKNMSIMVKGSSAKAIK